MVFLSQYGGRLQRSVRIIKTPLSEMKGMQEKGSIMGVRDR